MFVKLSKSSSVISTVRDIAPCHGYGSGCYGVETVIGSSKSLGLFLI